MKRSRDRILTTHTGSLPRPPELVSIMRARENGQPYDEGALGAMVRSAVAETVRRQEQAGVDVVSDGEMGKPGFFQYVRNRIGGLEGLNPEARINLDRIFLSTRPGGSARASTRPSLRAGRNALAPWLGKTGMPSRRTLAPSRPR